MRSTAVPTDAPAPASPMRRDPAERVRAAAERLAETGDEAPLREAAREIAAEAAARGLRAEDLVVAFKQLWTSIPALSPLRRRGRPLLDELVTLCIDEFYRRRRDGGR